MKTCKKCGEEKELSEFYVVKGYHRGTCKVCYLKHSYDRYTRTGRRKNKRRTLSTHSQLKILADILAEMPCSVCGEVDPLFLVFHHRDPSQKKSTVSKYFGSLEALMAEVKKCDVMCLFCHQREHYYLDGDGIKRKRRTLSQL